MVYMFRLPIKVELPRWVTRAEVKSLTLLAHLKALWRIWNLRSLILLSLGLQGLLILVGPFRKKTANTMVVITIWLAYLLADYIAMQAIGLIPNYSARYSSATHPDLLAFWAPFLLVHLGGPDPITALSLEDNELWLRTALHLFTFMSSTGRVFFQSLPTNMLSIPTILMFFAGFFKYLERTLSLYYARLTKFKSSLMTDLDSVPNYRYLNLNYPTSTLPGAKHSQPNVQNNSDASYLDDIRLSMNTESNHHNHNKEEEEDEVSHGHNGQGMKDTIASGRSWRKVMQVSDAYAFFEKYKGLYVDLTFSLRDRDGSRAYFLHPSLKPEDAFTVLEMELNFTYEVFFTKMIVIHQAFGTWIRSISFVFEVLCLVIWIFFVDKKLFHRFDIWITYTLLVGAVIVDSVGFIRVVLSDWQVTKVNKNSKIRVYLYEKLLSTRNRTWGSFWEGKDSSFFQWLKRMFLRRWSESIFQFNLTGYCVPPVSNFTDSLFKSIPPIKEKCQELKYVSKKWFADDLRDFIFDELRYKAEMAQLLSEAERICNSKGDWVLRLVAGIEVDPFVFYKWTVDVEYDKCLLLWHIATELLYQTGNKDDNEEKYRKCCKTLSDYMMYLLKWQPGLMSAVAGNSEVRFQDTCEDVKFIFDKVLNKAEKAKSKEQRLTTACKNLMDIRTDMGWRYKKRRRDKSVLLEALRLTEELMKLKECKEFVGMWELMAKVWVELMCYSATHIRASAHAAQLKQGGELITLVWLLMVHLGLATRQFSITQDNI